MSLEVYESCPELLKNVSALSLRVGFAEWISTPCSHLKQPQKKDAWQVHFVSSESVVSVLLPELVRIPGGNWCTEQLQAPWWWVYCGASTWFCRLVTFFYHRLSQAPLCWVSTLKYPPNFLSIARFVNFMYQRSWLLLLSFSSIVAQRSLWDTFWFEFLWTSSEDKCTYDVTLQNVHESIYHLGIGLVWYYEVHSPFL